MNLYIILNHGIGNIGGGQLYVSSKKRYMEYIGWKVVVYYHLDGEIMIPNLLEYNENQIQELALPPTYFSKKKCNKVLNKLYRYHNEAKKIIIESGGSNLAMWGELLAEKMKGKHIVYDLNEKIKATRNNFSFFYFKYKRNEFAGITPQSVNMFFKGFIDVPISTETCLSAYYDQQQVADVNFNIHKKFLDKTAINIALCGRLEKPFMLVVSKELANFALKHQGIRFNIIVIGGDVVGLNYTKKIQSIFAHISNVDCNMFGFLFPLPKKLLNIIDFAISSSGFVGVLSRNDIPTLAVDGNDCMPIGIHGITTRTTLYRKDDELFSYDYWFEKMFIKHDFEKKDIDIQCSVDNNYLKLSSHMDFITKSSRVEGYYTEFGKKSYLKMLVIKLIGVKGYRLLHVFKNNIIVR